MGAGGAVAGLRWPEGMPRLGGRHVSARVSTGFRKRTRVVCAAAGADEDASSSSSSVGGGVSTATTMDEMVREANTGRELLYLDEWIEMHAGLPAECVRFPGVFAVHSRDNVVQYVGRTNDCVNALSRVVANVGDTDVAHLVRVRAYDASLATCQDDMEAEQQLWIQASGAIPPGNLSPACDVWEGRVRDPSSSSSSSTKADLFSEGAPVPVTGDKGMDALAGRGPRPQVLTSPFERAELMASDRDGLLELNAENVDRELELVRPVLLADGGNIGVVFAGVEPGTGVRKVLVELQGACGSCPSSKATMQGGVEKVLKRAFGDDLVVEDMPAPPPEGGELVTEEACNDVLVDLLPAITAYGGDVSVTGVKDGGATVELYYDGPEAILNGIKLSLRDSFAAIVNIVVTQPGPDGTLVTSGAKSCIEEASDIDKRDELLERLEMPTLDDPDEVW